MRWPRTHRRRSLETYPPKAGSPAAFSPPRNKGQRDKRPRGREDAAQDRVVRKTGRTCVPGPHNGFVRYRRRGGRRPTAGESPSCRDVNAGPPPRAGVKSEEPHHKPPTKSAGEGSKIGEAAGYRPGPTSQAPAELGDVDPAGFQALLAARPIFEIGAIQKRPRSNAAATSPRRSSGGRSRP